MRAHPSALPTIQNQGALFGEIISDLVSEGMPITDILTQILSFGPVSLRDAVHVARFMQPGTDRLQPHTLRDDNTPSSWHPTRASARPLGPCQVCGGPSHEYYFTPGQRAGSTSGF